MKNEDERQEVSSRIHNQIASSTMIQPAANLSSLFGEVSNLSSSGVPTISSGTMRQLGPIIEAALAEDDGQNQLFEADNNFGCNNQLFAVRNALPTVEAAPMNMFDGYSLHAPVALGNQYRKVTTVYETDESTDESFGNESGSTVIEALRRLNLKDVDIEQVGHGSSMAPVNQPSVAPSSASNVRLHLQNRRAAMANQDRAFAPVSEIGDSNSEVTPPLIQIATPTSNAPRKKPREESESNVNTALRCLNLFDDTETLGHGSSLALVKYYRPSTQKSEMVRYQAPTTTAPTANQAVSSLALVRYRRPPVEPPSSSVVRYHPQNPPVNNLRAIEYTVNDLNIADLDLYEDINSPDTFESSE